MRVEESFVIAEPRERLWEFFEQVEQVARCVPGVESVEVLDEQNSKVRVTQAVGPMTATFDLKMRITEREPNELMQFTAVGRAVKGAAGNVRTTNTVRLADVDEGTRVSLESDLAMGGGRVTKEFSEALQRAIKGEPEIVEAPPAEPVPAPPVAGAMPAARDGRAPQIARVAVAVAVALVMWRVLVRARNR
jgi:carbon monoxide dehydrogenase subunit G